MALIAAALSAVVAVLVSLLAFDPVPVQADHPVFCGPTTCTPATSYPPGVASRSVDNGSKLKPLR
jgi:hypothetical protein